MSVEIEPEFQRMFDAVDTDHSGRISARELYKILTSRGDRVTLEASCLLIRLFDNGHDSIDIQGFACLIILFVNWTNVFKSFDLDESGFIDKRELGQALEELYPQYFFDIDYLEMLILKFGDPRRREGLTDDQFLFACAFVEHSPPPTFSLYQWTYRS